MLKLTTAAVIGAFAFAPAAFAKGHSNSNAEAATGMATVLKENAKDGILGEPGASVAKTLDKAGWGNGGSGIAPGTIVAPAKRD